MGMPPARRAKRGLARVPCFRFVFACESMFPAFLLKPGRRIGV
jgi:hypothetical protein